MIFYRQAQIETAGLTSVASGDKGLIGVLIRSLLSMTTASSS